MNTDSIRATVLDGRTKGIPSTTEPFALSDIADKNWNVLREELPLPLMVLKRANLDHNAQIFGDYLTKNQLSLAPHGKTTMSPQLFQEQLRTGAWGITAATVNQVQVMRHYDVKRVVLANQLVGKAHLLAIAEMLNTESEFEFYCFIDSVAQLDNMARNLEDVSLRQPIRLLIEVGVGGGRTGIRTTQSANDIAEALAKANPEKFKFAGVAAFEGVIPTPDGDMQPVIDFADRVIEVAKSLPASLYENLDEFILSGGGSSFFDLIADRFKTVSLSVPVRVLLRSGCYITTDSGAYKKAQDAAQADPHRSWESELRPALEAWAYVQSLPEDGLAFLTMGKRDVPFDAGLPVPFKLFRPGVGFLDVGEAEIFATNDQHAYVRLSPGTDWQVGDLVASGISHPCTAFDKWQFIPIVDDEYNVIDGVLTHF